MQHLVHAKTIPAALPRHSQRGVTLIELMVGILIGMLVVAVALLTLSSTRSSSVVVNDVTRLEQQTNMTMDVIGQQINAKGVIFAHVWLAFEDLNNFVCMRRKPSLLARQEIFTQAIQHRDAEHASA